MRIFADNRAPGYTDASAREESAMKSSSGPRQMFLEGTAPPQHDDIDAAVAALRAARGDVRRATERLKHAESVLVQRMLQREVSRYQHKASDGGRWVLALSLPEQPSVRMKYLGPDDDDNDDNEGDGG